MTGYNEVSYSIIIKESNARYLFHKRSIIYNDRRYEAYLQPTINPDVLEIFRCLYPVLRTIPDDNIELIRGWESFHPSDTLPENLYDEREADFITSHYRMWRDKLEQSLLYIIDPDLRQSDREAQAYVETLARYKEQ